MSVNFLVVISSEMIGLSYPIANIKRNNSLVTRSCGVRHLYITAEKYLCCFLSSLRLWETHLLAKHLFCCTFEISCFIDSCGWVRVSEKCQWSVREPVLGTVALWYPES